MYCCSASSADEGMNAANKQLQTRMTVDLLNVTLLLIIMKCNRFPKQKQQAWGGNSILTPCGHEEYNRTFENQHQNMHNTSCTKCDDSWVCRVQHTVRDTAPQTVIYPKLLVNSSYFGTCTCGANKTKAAPRDHMAAMALSTAICPQITPVNIMPIWWKRTQWQLQFLSNVYTKANLTIQAIKNGRIPNVGLHFCTDRTAEKKARNPKKGERFKSGLEKAMVKLGGMKVMATKKRCRCQVCGKFGHNNKKLFHPIDTE
jgi:hypothetical protein